MFMEQHDKIFTAFRTIAICYKPFLRNVAKLINSSNSVRTHYQTTAVRLLIATCLAIAFCCDFIYMNVSVSLWSTVKQYRAVLCQNDIVPLPSGHVGKTVSYLGT